MIISRDELIKKIEALRAAGKKIGYTSGVFDLLHAGHVSYLADAKKKVDILVVGINSDSSVGRLKGEKRPIMPQQDRAAVLSELKSVDYVFIFEEDNNKQNIKLLRPDFYIKAGDYSPDKLSSTPIVESYGGQVAIMPFADKRSTTSTINKILANYSDEIPTTIKIQPLERRPALFVDRDGTINEEVLYCHDPADFKIIPGVLEGLKQAQAAGYRIVVVTNQAGIGLGYYSKEDFFAVNQKLLRAAKQVGLMIDQIKYCPHPITAGCKCRKPGTELYLTAARDLNIDIATSYVVGDMTVDIEAGNRLGCKSILVKTGNAGRDGSCLNAKPDFVIASLAEVAGVLFNR